MKLLKSLLIVSIIISAVFFASCSDHDDYVKRGNMYFTTEDYSRVPNTDPDGHFNIGIELTLDQINSYSRYDRLRRIDLYNSWFSLINYNFRRGDYVDLAMSTTRIRNPYRVRLTFDSYDKTAYIDGQDYNYFRFMQAVMDELTDYGYTQFYVDGLISDISGRSPGVVQFDLILESDVDLIIRD